MTLASRSITLTINARNGTVAEDIARTELKRRHEHFDIEGWTRPGPDLPNDKVAAYEQTTRTPLPTYHVAVTLYTFEFASDLLAWPGEVITTEAHDR